MTDGPLRVLVVEDDEGLRYAMQHAFEQAGFVVDAAPDGKRAVQLLTDHPSGYACAVLDMIIPGVHGSSLISHIARTSPRLPVIAVTGFADRVLFAEQADRHVVKAIFVKPVEPVDVAAFVKSRWSR
jgi:CheY-like chemotaxis protein